MTVVVLAEARFACAVERLHRRGPCALLEMLTELGATRRTEIEQLVALSARIDQDTVAAVGGDHRLPAPIHLVANHLEAALGHLHEAESGVGGDPGVLLHQLNMLGMAIEDARDLASGRGCAS